MHNVILFLVQVQKVPGIVIFRFIAPLCFTNVSVFKSRLAKASGVNPAHFDRTIRPKGCLEQGVNMVSSKTSDNFYYVQCIRSILKNTFYYVYMYVRTIF